MQLGLVLCVTHTLAVSLARAAPPDWSGVRAALARGLAARVTPGLAAGVRTADGVVAFFEAHGALTYGEPTPLGAPNSPTTVDTLFDLASCSKLVGPVTAAARLYELGLLPPLDTPVADAALLGPAFAASGKAAVTLRHLLLHDAGLPPDPSPGYGAAAFGCPATAVQPTPPLALSCVEAIFAAVLNQSLVRPPGEEYVYSDLSMITLLFAVGRVAARAGLVDAGDFRAECAALAPAPGGGAFALCAYEAYWRLAIKPRLFAGGAAAPTAYLLDRALWPQAQPTYADPSYRHETMQGAVGDANAYASGGISGHAGVFSTLGDVLNFTAVWQYGASGLLNATTTRAWTTVANASFSPRALGWLTQAPTDPYQGCGNLSAATFYHTGYTGQLMCVDPVRNISTVLLTSRVYPDEGNVAGILELRQSFNNAVLEALTLTLGARGAS